MANSRKGIEPTSAQGGGRMTENAIGTAKGYDPLKSIKKMGAKKYTGIAGKTFYLNKVTPTIMEVYDSEGHYLTDVKNKDEFLKEFGNAYSHGTNL